MSILSDVLQDFERAYIVVDALDECSQRPRLLEVLSVMHG